MSVGDAMKFRIRFVGCLALVLALGACAQTISSSETHISILHSVRPVGVIAAFEMAEKHCQQFGKVAVRSVSGALGNASTFSCE